MYVVYNCYGTGLENKTKSLEPAAFVIQMCESKFYQNLPSDSKRNKNKKQKKSWLAEDDSKKVEKPYVKYHFCNNIVFVICCEINLVGVG